MEATKAGNIIEHEAEIYSRPKREWFVTESQKKASAKAAAQHEQTARPTGQGTKKTKDAQKEHQKGPKGEHKGIANCRDVSVLGCLPAHGPTMSMYRITPIRSCYRGRAEQAAEGQHTCRGHTKGDGFSQGRKGCCKGVPGERCQAKGSCKGCVDSHWCIQTREAEAQAQATRHCITGRPWIESSTHITCVRWCGSHFCSLLYKKSLPLVLLAALLSRQAHSALMCLCYTPNTALHACLHVLSSHQVTPQQCPLTWIAQLACLWQPPAAAARKSCSGPVCLNGMGWRAGGGKSGSVKAAKTGPSKADRARIQRGGKGKGQFKGKARYKRK
jgi:hypothetical protein